MTQPKLWVLVLNSESARILRGLHRDGRCDLSPVEMTLDHNRLGEIMADRPGRSFRSAGPGRSAIEYASDPVRDRQMAFVHSLVERLEDERARGAFDELAIIASRPMLGMVRQEITPALARMVRVEIGKNLVHQTGAELAATVAGLVHKLPEG